MAGVKGRSGGARPNTGGARPGAGRKPKEKPKAAELPAVTNESPLDFLLRIQNDPNQSVADRLKAAITAAPFVHTKVHEGGKKDAQNARGRAAGTGRFAPASPPKLAVVSRR